MTLKLDTFEIIVLRQALAMYFEEHRNTFDAFSQARIGNLLTQLKKVSE